MRGLVIAAVSAAALAMACGGSGESRPTPSATGTAEVPTVATEPTPTASPTATPAPQPSTLIAYEVIAVPAGQEGTTILQSVSEIYGVDIETGERHLILANPDMTLVSWAWSPDGEFVAGLMMSRNLHTDRQARIDVVAVDGTGQTTVWEANLSGPYPGFVLEGPFDGGYVTFAWNPDSEHIEVIQGGSGRAEWLRYPATGGHESPVRTFETALTTQTGLLAWRAGAHLPLATFDLEDNSTTVALFSLLGEPVESLHAPDGYRLGTAAARTQGEQMVALYCEKDGGEAAAAYAICIWNPGEPLVPIEGASAGSLSPDGTKMLTGVTDLDAQPARSYTVIVDARTEERLQVFDEFLGAAWSPDGTLLAFTSGRDHPETPLGTIRQRDVYVMSADGTNPRRLTTETFPIGLTVRWQPR